MDRHTNGSPKQRVVNQETRSSEPLSVPLPSNPTNRCLGEPLGGDWSAEDALPGVVHNVLPQLLVEPEVDLVLRFHQRV